MGTKTEASMKQETCRALTYCVATVRLCFLVLCRPSEEADAGSEETKGAAERRNELRASSQPLNASIQSRWQRKPRAPQGGEEAERRDAQPAGQTSPSSHIPADPSPHTDSNSTTNPTTHSQPAGLAQSPAAPLHQDGCCRYVGPAALPTRRRGRTAENQQSDWPRVRLSLCHRVSQQLCKHRRC